MEIQTEHRIIIEDILESKTKPHEEQLGFGQYFTDRMLISRWDGNQWNTPRITKYSCLDLDPAALVFHYGQAIFEGMKAYRQEEDDVKLFRPYDNAIRLNKSAKRIVMPEFDPDLFVFGIKKLVELEKAWVPTKKGSSLYIRPTMIATEEILGVRSANEYLFFVILSPSGPYFSTGFNPTKIIVEEEYIRAHKGGTGSAKFAGNYASSLIASKKAKSQGYNQVLWLDAEYRKFVEEVGSMNIAFVINDEIYSPKPKGTILDGITRRSIKTLAYDLNIPFNEGRIGIEEVVECIQDGSLTEAFGIGTAAVISPIGVLHFQGEDYFVNNNETGPVARTLFGKLTNIQYGIDEDLYNWMV